VSTGIIAFGRALPWLIVILFTGLGAWIGSQLDGDGGTAAESASENELILTMLPSAATARTGSG
jgi:hypothetical protein